MKSENRNTKQPYLSIEIRLVEVAVENGFAASTGEGLSSEVRLNDMNNEEVTGW